MNGRNPLGPLSYGLALTILIVVNLVEVFIDHGGWWNIAAIVLAIAGLAGLYFLHRRIRQLEAETALYLMLTKIVEDQHRQSGLRNPRRLP